MFDWFKKKKTPPPRGTPDQLIPLIKRSESSDGHAGPTIVMEGDQAPVLEPLVGGLHIAYAFDVGPHFEWMLEGRRRELGLERSELRALAVKNYGRLAENLRLQTFGPCYAVLANGYLETSLLLADSFWMEQEKQVQGPLIAAVPARDMLSFTGLDDPGGPDMLREVIRKTSGPQVDHPLISELLVWRGGRWEVLG